MMNNLIFLFCLCFLAFNCRPGEAKYETFSQYGRTIEVAPRGMVVNPNSAYGTNYGTNTGYGSNYGTARNGPAEIDVKIVGTDYNQARRNRRMTDEMQTNQVGS